jgi:hypothetical protein
MKVYRNNITNEPKYIESKDFLNFYILFLHRIQYGLGSTSDYYAFDQLVGSSNFDACYTFNSADYGTMDSHPLYHTSYETFSMVKKFVDPDFSVNR